MKKNFLVTISNDVSHLFGVRFLCSFFTALPEDQITLLHICRLDDTSMAGMLNEMWRDHSLSVESQLSLQAKKAIQKARSLLSQHAITVDQVVTKTYAERYGKVKDILAEGAKGLYDAIILGRRASYSLQWMFERPADETAHAMIKDTCCSTPFWICPEVEPDRKNVLVCLDGSQNSLRMVDHVGYILADQDRHHLTLFHVEEGGVKAEELFIRAEKILLEHGVPSHRLTRKTAWGITVAGTIRGEIDKGSYAAVAIGLRGEKQEKTTNLPGESTKKLISKVERASLWCCP